MEPVGFLLGEWLPPFALAAALVFCALRGKESRKWRLAAVVAVALSYLVVTNTKDVIASADVKAATNILANVKTLEDLNKAINENPDNQLMQLLKVSMSVKQQAGQRVMSRKRILLFDDRLKYEPFLGLRIELIGALSSLPSRIRPAN